MFEERDWNTPWPVFLKDGMTKDRFSGFFKAHYNICYAGEVAEIGCWELTEVFPVPERTQSQGHVRDMPLPQMNTQFQMKQWKGDKDDV